MHKLKNKLALVIVFSIVLSLKSYSQLNFRKGYLIKEGGHKIECFIKTTLKKQPKEIIYRSTENGEDKTINIRNVKEYSILNEFVVEKHVLKVDLSSNVLNEMNYDKDPHFVTKEGFLKLIIKGDMSLYVYEKGNLTKYFIKNSKNEVEQLFFKKFKYKGLVKENVAFRKQLWEKLKCDDVTLKYLFKVNYTLSDLTAIFIKYNKCQNSDFVFVKQNKKKGKFNFTLRPGYNLVNYKLEDFSAGGINSSSNYNTKINSGEIRVGMEIEYTLPFFDNKWSIALEPTYRNFKSASTKKTVRETTTSTDVVNIIVDYNSLEIPFNIRYYSFINDDIKMFINGGFIYDFAISSSLEFKSENMTNSNFNRFEEIETNNIDLDFGIGLKYKENFSFELRYYTKRVLTIDSLRFELSYQTISAIFGYTIF